MNFSKKVMILSVLAVLSSSCSSEVNKPSTQDSLYSKQNILGSQADVTANSTPESKQSYNQYIGKWTYGNYDNGNELQSNIKLEVDKISELNIEGEYCYISNYGEKIDCEAPFTGVSVSHNKYLVHFKSSFGDATGQATIFFNDSNQLEWELQSISGDAGVPIFKKGILSRKLNKASQINTSIKETQPDSDKTEPDLKHDSCEISQKVPLKSLEDNTFFIESSCYKNSTHFYKYQLKSNNAIVTFDKINDEDGFSSKNKAISLYQSKNHGLVLLSIAASEVCCENQIEGGFYEIAIYSMVKQNNGYTITKIHSSDLNFNNSGFDVTTIDSSDNFQYKKIASLKKKLKEINF